MSRGHRGTEKRRNLSSLKRKKPSLPPKPRVLIVCEGAETEPRYFDRFRIEQRLSKELFCILGGDQCGAHPKSVVAYTKKVARQARQDGFGFDHVWCVFDRNQHENIHNAFQQVHANGFSLAFSNPCFELWYLLHFQDQGAEIDSAAVAHELKRYIARYTKSTDVYDILDDKQRDAIRRAEALRLHHASDEGIPPNPSTSVDTLVVFLNQLGGQPKGAGKGETVIQAVAPNPVFPTKPASPVSFGSTEGAS